MVVAARGVVVVDGEAEVVGLAAGQGDVAFAAGELVLRMERYQCNSCHVPQVDAKPLVTSTFVGNLPAK